MSMASSASKVTICLFFPLTHAQIGSAIGSTRVTVTRLMGKLRQGGMIQNYGEGLICISKETGWKQQNPG